MTQTLHLQKPFLDDTPRTFIFHHIGRSGGGDIDEICVQLYGNEATFNVTERRGLARLDHYLSLPDSEKLNIKVITGHNSFGIHELVPGAYAYFTLLRNPVDEFISQYYWFITGIPKDAHQKHLGIPLEEFGFEQYVEYAENNGYDVITSTNWLAAHWHGKRLGKEVRSAVAIKENSFLAQERCTQEIFELAVENLKNHYAFIGITEKYAESVFLLGKMMRWERLIPYAQSNRAQKSVQKSTLSPALLERIRKLRFYDLKLYALAQEWFSNLTEQEGVSQDPAFSAYLKTVEESRQSSSAPTDSIYVRKFLEQNVI